MSIRRRSFTIPSPTLSPHTLLSFPTSYIVLVTLNRPDVLNCIDNAQHHELAAVWQWMDEEPRIRCGIITGKGRAFCAGADLKGLLPGCFIETEWNMRNATGEKRSLPPSGFGGLSRRSGKKPVVAAVNGLCLGGGMEMVINCDLVVAAKGAFFGLPEVQLGVLALAGALPRLAGAEEMREWGIVNTIVDDDREGVVKQAVHVTEKICGNSPDSVIVSKMGVDIGWQCSDVEEATERIVSEGWSEMEGRENMREGLKAYVERRKARWIDSKL
ncbi:MAG: hypothetical protein LQ348_002697 [Seirophora lacunosa]|nr:MAG: hypothetical protein LQ348_002697 [Seirophora lacunosa]